MKKILIIAPYQFGELLDCYYWAKYAAESGYNITYIGYRYKDRKAKPMKLDSVRLISVLRDVNPLLFAIRFFYTIVKTILFSRFQNIIVVKFPHCQILPILFPKRNIVFDIRTASVSGDEQLRARQDGEITKVSSHFKRISVISQGVADHLHIPMQKCRILPLGAMEISGKIKDFSQLRLLYIGTFNNRHLDVLLRGISLFRQKYNKKFSFDIVGSGTSDIERSLKQLTDSLSLDDIMTFHGYMNHDQVVPLFDRCNVGVSFVPITSYYDHQPPTKTFEYLSSGMACLATRTKANELVVNVNNGVLTTDSEEGVCEGLERLVAKLSFFDSEEIRLHARKYSWKHIVESKFLSLFS